MFRLQSQYRSSKHLEEAAKLTASLVNGVAIACLIGASFGPWLNPTMNWGWRSLVLFVGAGLFHIGAQVVLSFGFRREP